MEEFLSAVPACSCLFSLFNYLKYDVWQFIMSDDPDAEVLESEPSCQQTADTRPDNPTHAPQESLLSHASGFNNYRGFLNLCIVLLGMSTGRLVLENLIKYGILMDPIMWLSIFIKHPYSWPNLSLIIFLNVFILIAFGIEKLAAKDNIGPRTTGILTTLNIMTVFVFPVTVIVYSRPNPVGSFFSLGAYTIAFMKLISYSAVNEWCRKASKEASREEQATDQGDKSLRRSPRRHSSPPSVVRKRVTRGRNFSECSEQQENGHIASDNSAAELVKYPENLNLRDMYYFMVVPTLCYELNFPRTKRVRKRFLIRRIVELIFLMQLSLCLVQQWIVPTVMNAMEPFTSLDGKRMIERVLKLAVPNHICWLLFFYFFFHSLLNITAEVFRFADRNFYQDWWNAETIGYFWKNWNIPVHKWCYRHVYKPLLQKGLTRFQASMVVFLISAVFHEYLVSIPLQMFRMWAFWGMMCQLPLAVFTSRVTGHYGNMLVWVSLIIGQPIAVLMYVHDYYIVNFAPVVNATSP